MIVNKLQSIFTKIKLDKNRLTYQFHTNLDSKHSRYFKRYFQEHDRFNKDRNTKHTFSSTIQHFQNIVYNPSSSKKSVIFIAAVTPNIAFISPNQPSNQTKI